MAHLLTIQELAIFLQISPKTIYNLVSKDSIPYVRAGGSLRFILSDIENWLITSSQYKGGK